MKRILCSILVVVMLALTFVGCGYSVEEDNMTSYATINKVGLEELLKKIQIEDGDFTTVSATRDKKVWDSIYAAVADSVGTDAVAKTEGIPDGRDVIYYSYYAKATVKDTTTEDPDDTVEIIIFTDKMKSDSAAKIQLGASYDGKDGEFANKILAVLTGYDFSNGYYVSVTSGTAVAGDVAYVTYTVTGTDNVPVTYTNKPITIKPAPANKTEASQSLEEYLDGEGIGQYGNIKQFSIKDAEGKLKETYSNIKINWVSSRIIFGKTELGDKVYVSYKETVKKADGDKETNKTQQAITISDVADSFENLLLDKDVNTLLKVGDANLTYETTDADGNKVIYSNIRIEWIAGDGKELGSFTDVTFDEKTMVKDLTGYERDLKDAEITYYVYPVNYKETPDFTAELLVDKILGKDITVDTVLEIIFANEFAKLGDDPTKAEIEGVKAFAVDYKVSAEYKVEGLKNLTIANLVDKIAQYYTDIKTADTSLENAKTLLDTAKKNYNTAESELEAAKATGDQAKIDEAQTKFDDAKSKMAEAETKQKDQQDSHDKIEQDKKDAIEALLTITKAGTENTDAPIRLDAKLYDGYRILMYNAHQEAYNEEIKTKLAKEIYYFITESITLKGKLPEDLVDDCYNQIFEKYEADFYTGKDSSNKTYYSIYKGSFDAFLTATVSADETMREVANAKEAKAAIKEKAEKSAGDIVKIFLAAQTYGKVITESDYDKYKNELEDYYYYYVLYYKNFDIEEMLGENNIKTAAQLKKLLDWFLAFDETEPVADGIFTKIEYKYTNTAILNSEGNAYIFGTPASDAEKNTGAN